MFLFLLLPLNLKVRGGGGGEGDVLSPTSVCLSILPSHTVICMYAGVCTLYIAGLSDWMPI